MPLLLVAAGGALGGVLRVALSNAVARRFPPPFPWGTLVVNVSGAFVAGAWLGHHGLPQGEADLAWLLVVGGLLGGYTTASSFSLQTLALWQQGEGAKALWSAAATLYGGLLAAALGAALFGGLAL